jgi:hypothetical protein
MSTSALFPLHPDSTTSGVRFLNVTARVHEDRLRFTGTFDAAELLPVLLFSVGVPWVEPCVANVCCLWEVASRYKDNDLLGSIGDSCNENMNFTGRRLMKGSTITSAGATLQQWDLTTRIHPNFVVMLFLCLSPVFYMYYEVVPVQWIERQSVPWSAAWYGDPCHTVAYPDGREVCIHCSNPKPPHSAYVFSAEWFRTFECKWICNPGHTGPNCEVAIDTALYAAGGMFIVMCISGIMLVAMYGRNLGTLRATSKKSIEAGAVEPAPVADSKPMAMQAPTPQRAAPPAKLEAITFKDSSKNPMMMMGEIRIKLL